MVNDEKVRSRRNSFPNGSQARVHRRRNFRYRTAILHLQSVHGTRPVGELLRLERAITVSDNRFQTAFLHVRDVSWCRAESQFAKSGWRDEKSVRNIFNQDVVFSRGAPIVALTLQRDEW